MNSNLNSRIFVFDYSFLFLLATNIITIIFAVVQNWNFQTILFVYLGQSIIIGFFNFIRILSLKKFSTENFTINNKPVKPTKGTKIFTAFFFILHYGIFHVVYFIFLAIFSFFSIESMETKYLFYALGIFFVNHLFSFYYNKEKDNSKNSNIGKLMFHPYVRIIPMHIIIIIGGFLYGFEFYSKTFMVLFLALKTFTDLIMHNLGHN